MPFNPWKRGAYKTADQILLTWTGCLQLGNVVAQTHAPTFGKSVHELTVLGVVPIMTAASKRISYMQEGSIAIPQWR